MKNRSRLFTLLSAIMLLCSCTLAPTGSQTTSSADSSSEQSSSSLTHSSDFVSSDGESSFIDSDSSVSEEDSSSIETTSESSSSEDSGVASSSEEESSSEESFVSSEESIDSSEESEDSSSAASSSDVYTDDDWHMNLSLYGATFQATLAQKINATRTKTCTYNDCLSVGAKAAAYPNAASSTFIPFYHEAKNSEKTSSGCNREHTWPKSRGSGKTGMGADPIMVRPTLSSENSSRGNNFYGLSGSGNREWDPASCGYEGARGEAARVILYCATAYYAQGFSLSNNPFDGTDQHTMGTLSTLLRWNRDYPPSDFEILVCDRYDSMGYARNAFVDHPEFADYIYDNNGIRTSAPSF